MKVYFRSVNAKGEPAFDEHRLSLLDCSRGTSDAENSHKHIIATLGTDYLLAEQRHRYNNKVPERRRTGFPRLGH